MVGSAVFKKMRVEDGQGVAEGTKGKSQGTGQAKPSTIDKKHLAKDLEQKVADVMKSEKNSEQQPQQEAEGADEVNATGRPAKKLRLDGSVSTGCQAPGKAHMHQKQHHKRNQFTGFSEDEISHYVTFIEPLQREKCVERPKSALDEMICALHWVRSKIAESEVGTDGAGASGCKASAMASKVSKEFSTSMTFCLSLFLQFAYLGEVSANGRMFKAYTALRTELQSLMFQAQDLWQEFGSVKD